MAPSSRQKQLEDQLKAQLGADAFHEGWSSLLQIDPEFFSASLALASVPKQKSHLPGHLSAKDQELIALAVSAAATHLYAPGIRAHAKAALNQGATIHEVLEVIELSSTLSIHACNVGVPLLAEVLKEEKDPAKYEAFISREYDERQKALQKEFTDKRGYWHPTWDDFLRMDPDFFKAYLDFSSVPWTKDVDGKGEGKGALEPKMKELVYCAFDCSATHLYIPGLKLHYKNALRYGATPQEILGVLEIATLLGLHTAQVSSPIIRELASAAGSTS